jgi:transposase
MRSQHQEAKTGAANAKPEVIKLGLDLHARQVTECRQLDASTPKPAQKWDPWKLLDQVEAWVKAGIKVYSCYEAGACGYWFHRELVKRGAVNFVVAPRPLEFQRRRHQKTDRLDARGLLDHLESYLRGNREAMSVVAVPSPEQEQQRSIVRYREQLMRNRRRAPGAGSSAGPEPGHPGPGGLVAARGLGAVSAPAARVAQAPSCNTGNRRRWPSMAKNAKCAVSWRPWSLGSCRSASGR